MGCSDSVIWIWVVDSEQRDGAFLGIFRNFSPQNIDWDTFQILRVVGQFKHIGRKEGAILTDHVHGTVNVHLKKSKEN